jgi:hypothetical protein
MGPPSRFSTVKGKGAGLMAYMGLHGGIVFFILSHQGQEKASFLSKSNPL